MLGLFRSIKTINWILTMPLFSNRAAYRTTKLCGAAGISLTLWKYQLLRMEARRIRVRPCRTPAPSLGAGHPGQLQPEGFAGGIPTVRVAVLHSARTVFVIVVADSELIVVLGIGVKGQRLLERLDLVSEAGALNPGLCQFLVPGVRRPWQSVFAHGWFPFMVVRCRAGESNPPETGQATSARRGWN